MTYNDSKVWREVDEGCRRFWSKRNLPPPPVSMFHVADTVRDNQGVGGIDEGGDRFKGFRSIPTKEFYEAELIVDGKSTFIEPKGRGKELRKTCSAWVREGKPFVLIYWHYDEGAGPPTIRSIINFKYKDADDVPIATLTRWASELPTCFVGGILGRCQWFVEKRVKEHRDSLA